MSGHSHFSTIKRQKEAKDAVKGKVFSRHSKNITLAIKAGGSADPELNSKLRFAIDQAKVDNMPKTNIDRILERAEEAKNMDEIVYEGFGPSGVSFVVNAATDNKNRTAQEIKGIFDKAGGSMGGPNSVLFNFEQKGQIVVKKNEKGEDQMLELIDLGVDDVTEEKDVIVCFTPYEKLAEIKDEMILKGNEVESFEIVMKPINFVEVADVDKAGKNIKLMETLENQDDVQNVFTNLDIPESIAGQIT